MLTLSGMLDSEKAATARDLPKRSTAPTSGIEINIAGRTGYL
ncbi:MAG: hypothetical protein R2860_02300 [Desulfobacterales bacterium]